jgi:hypothetical protein
VASAKAKKKKKNTINRRYRDARDGLVEELGTEIKTFSEGHGINGNGIKLIDSHQHVVRRLCHEEWTEPRVSRRVAR